MSRSRRAMRLGRRITVLMATVAAAYAGSVRAQSPEYPVRPVRVIVGQAPGGANDIQTRLFAHKLSERFGRSFVVENRTGGGSLVSYRMVARATPDGYTLLAAAGNYTIVSAVTPDLGFDPLKDLAPISLATQAPFLLFVHPSLPVLNVKELLALARARPGALMYGSAGQASATHLSFSLFTTLAGVDILHVPYRGTAPALNDTISGQVQMLMGNVLSSLVFAKRGQLRALAVTTAERSPILPDLPTLAEAGVPGYESMSWHGWLAPGDTARAIVDKLSAELAIAAKAPDVLARLEPDGALPIGGSPEVFRQFLIADIERWKRVVKQAGIKLE